MEFSLFQEGHRSVQISYVDPVHFGPDVDLILTNKKQDPVRKKILDPFPDFDLPCLFSGNNKDGFIPDMVPTKTFKLDYNFYPVFPVQNCNSCIGSM